MKKLAMIMVFASAMGVHGVANAEFYLTGNMAITSFDYEDVDNAIGYQLGAGYSFDNNFSFEIRYMDSGKADIDGTYDVDGATVSDLSLELSGYLATLSYTAPLSTVSEKNTWYVFGRGGLYDTDTEANGTVIFDGGSAVGTVSEGTTGLTIGFGIDWMPTPTFGLRATADVLFSNNDFADDNNVAVITLGTIFRLSGGKE